MLKNGIDPKEFAERIKSASANERWQLLGAYARWIAKGAKAQGVFGLVGILLLGASAYLALMLPVAGLGSITAYFGCALFAIVGIFLFRIAARREREWREANPFEY